MEKFPWLYGELVTIRVGANGPLVEANFIGAFRRMGGKVQYVFEVGGNIYIKDAEVFRINQPQKLSPLQSENPARAR